MTEKTECSCLKQKTNKGISCTVKGCNYHDGVSHCTASVINVGPSNASCSVDTSCVTFKPKSE